MDGKPVNNLPLATNALSAVALMQMNLSNNVQNNTMTAMGQTTDIALAQIVIVNAALAAQTNAIVWMGRTNDSQSARLTSNETHLTALDATNTSQWTSINAAHLTNALQQMTINSHTARILTNENSITGLNASNNSFAARILTNENSITGLNASNNSFTARILTNENAIAGLNASNNSFAARILTNENLTVLAITNILVTAPSGTGTVTRAGQVATVSFPVAGVASSQVPIIVSNIVQGTVITYTNRPRRTAELTAHSQWHQISPYIVNGRYSYSPNLVGANSYLERVRRYGPITFTAPVQPVSISGRVGWSVEAADIGYVKYGSVYWYELVPIDKPTFSWGTVPATVLEVFASNYTLGTDRAYVSGVFVNSPLMQRAWPGVRTNTISSYSLSQVTPATSYYIDVYACNMEMNMQGTTDAIYEKYPIAADQLSYSGPIYHTYTQYLTNAIFTIKYQDPQPPSGPGY
jgi:hypothetical protein